MWLLLTIALAKSPQQKCYTIRDVFSEGCRASCVITGDSGGFLGIDNHCYCTMDKGTYREYINRTMSLGSRTYVPSLEEKKKGLVAPFIFSKGRDYDFTTEPSQEE